jgi:imidazolonepropionase-like amidohydrolase
MKTFQTLVLTTVFATAAAAAEREILIRNATILTVSRGTIPNGAVLIRGSKIAAVGPVTTVAAGPGAQIIDASGKFVLPGIIDAHSHTAVDGSVNEGSLPNSGAVRIRDVVTNEDIDSYRQLSGGTTAANILHGSANSIGGQNAVVKWKWGKPLSEWFIPDAPPGIKFALGENPKSSNFQPPPGTPRQYPNTRMGVEEVIRDAFTRARDYMAEWDEYEARQGRREEAIAPKRDLLLEEMADILRGKVLVHSHCYRADEIVMLMRLGEEMGFKVRTFQHVLEGYKVAKEMARHGVGGSTFIDWWGFKIEAYDAIPYNVALMTRNGVLVSVNSDSAELARRLNLDAAKAIKYGGLTEDEALRTATLNPAMQLGIDHRVGSIDVGKDADLVIWNGHPLSTYSRVDTTFIEGEIYFDRERDLQMREQMRKEKEALLKAERDEEARERKEGGKSRRQRESAERRPTEVQ